MLNPEVALCLERSFHGSNLVASEDLTAKKIISCHSAIIQQEYMEMFYGGGTEHYAKY